jgi:hypothetical protein
VLPACCEDAKLVGVLQDGVDQYKRISASARNMGEVHAIFAKAVHELVCWLRGDVRDIISPVLPLLRALGQKTHNQMPTITETALLLSITGLIVLPQALLERIVHGQELSEEDLLLFAGHPEHAVEWIRHLPQLREVANILRDYANALHLSLLPESAEPMERPVICGEATLLSMVMEYRLGSFAQLENTGILALMRRNPLYSQSQIKALEAVLAEMDQGERSSPWTACGRAWSWPGRWSGRVTEWTSSWCRKDTSCPGRPLSFCASRHDTARSGNLSTFGKRASFIQKIMVPLEIRVRPFQYFLHLRRDPLGMHLPLIMTEIIGQGTSIFLIYKDN